MREDWLQRALRAIHRRQTGRLRGLPYPHSQAVRVAPAQPAPPFRKPSQTLPDVYPVPLHCKPHLWLVPTEQRGRQAREEWESVAEIVDDATDVCACGNAYPCPDCNPGPWQFWNTIEGRDDEEPYDRLHVSDEVDVQTAPLPDCPPADEPYEASRFDMKMQARILDFRARVERGEVRGGGEW